MLSSIAPCALLGPRVWIHPSTLQQSYLVAMLDFPGSPNSLGSWKELERMLDFPGSPNSLGSWKELERCILEWMMIKH